MHWGSVEVQWDAVPAAILDVITVLSRQARRSSDHVSRLVWPDAPGDVQDQLRMAIGDAHKILKAGTDLRAVLSAYARMFHNPRPVISKLARAQGTSSRGFIRRYSEATLTAVENLLSPTPDIGAIREGIPSLSLIDLGELGVPAGKAASELVAADSARDCVVRTFHTHSRAASGRCGSGKPPVVHPVLASLRSGCSSCSYRSNIAAPVRQRSANGR